MRSCHECGLRYAPSDTFCAADGAALVDSDDPLLGETVGSYRIVRVLGRGGMGCVYLGQHPLIGSRVAIKVLTEKASTDSALINRFFAEAQSVNKIRHDGIVNVLDLSHLPDGRPFIIMEHLSGQTLSACIHHAPLALGTAASIMLEILDALHAAHAAGVVHRDLKPDNIFISPKGNAKLLDFGIAKLMPNYEASLMGPETKTGALLGTPSYMAPEQIVGDPVSPATDLYAVGAILYEAVTGTKAFEGDTLFGLFNRIVAEAPAPPVQFRGELSGPYQDLILRALCKVPSERFGSALEMSEALRRVSSGLSDRGAWTPTLAYETPSPAARAPAPAATMTLGTDPQQVPATPAPRAWDSARSHESSAAQAPPSLTPKPWADSAATQDSGAGLHRSVSFDSQARTSNAPTEARPASRRNRLLVPILAVCAAAATYTVLLIATGKTKTPLIAQVATDASLPSGDAGLPAGDPMPATPPSTKPIGGEPTPPPVAGPGKRPSKTPGKTATKPRAPLVTSPTPDAGTTKRGGVHLEGVTIIETGNLPGNKRMHIPPDFNVKAFDAVAYLPKARKLAKKIYSDVYLTGFDVPAVSASGKTNLTLGRLEATYNFLSPSRKARTLPVGMEDDRPCWVYVEVDKKGVTARIVTWDECKGRPRPNPKCSLKQVWQRALALGAPKSGAVAKIDYLHDGWFFDIDALGVTESIPDDCQ